MKSTTSKNLDVLVKKIYQSYIDIKTDDFEEIRKEILLDDIKNLYSVVKELGNKDYEPEVDLETFAKNTNEVTEEKLIAPIEFENEVKHEETIELVSTPEEVISESKEEIPTEMTPSIVEEPTEEELTEKVTEVVEKELPIETEKTPVIVNSTEVIETASNETKEPEIIEEVEVAEPTKEKLSTEKIIDFLHKDESPKKEIYDYIDINTRIGLVEIFFKGNSIELSECLMKMNNLSTKSDCVNILNSYASRYSIDKESDIYNTFLNLIDRKYN